MIRTSGTELGSFSYISNIDSAYRLDAPEMKLSFDLACVENDDNDDDDDDEEAIMLLLLLLARTPPTAPRR